MIDPHRPDPTHPNDCLCDDCVTCRENWAANQPPLLDELDSRDGEDTHMPPIGTYAFTAMMMAQMCPVDDDPDFWDRWKDEQKEADLFD